MAQTTADADGLQRGDEDDVAGPVTPYTVLPAGTYPVEFINYERLETAVEQPQRPRLHLVHG